MGKVAAFRYQGGKARIRRHLVELFPKHGNLYLEPFAGRGNVFFLSKATLNFRLWQLNDVATTPFLQSLVEVDPESLPERVSKEEFKRLSCEDSALALALEPRISFCGKGYKFGFSGDRESDTGKRQHTGYRGTLYAETIRAAQRALIDVQLTSITWNELDLSGLTWKDFVYFDPPYLGTNSPYGNIDHTALLTELIDAPFRWAISGYRSRLYLDYLDEPVLSLKRKAEMQNLNHSSSRDVEESLWVNYL